MASRSISDSISDSACNSSLSDKESPSHPSAQEAIRLRGLSSSSSVSIREAMVSRAPSYNDSPRVNIPKERMATADSTSSVPPSFSDRRVRSRSRAAAGRKTDAISAATAKGSSIPEK